MKAFFAPCGHGAEKSVVTTGKINATLVHLVPAGRTHIVRLQRGTIWVPIKAMGGGRLRGLDDTGTDLHAHPARKRIADA